MEAKFYISDRILIELIVRKGSWERNDIPMDRLPEIARHFGSSDTLAVLGSGSIREPTEWGGMRVYAGIDWLRIERRPRPNELPVNSHHFVVGAQTERGWPVYGPYRRGCVVRHWCAESEFDDFLQGGSRA